MMNAFYCKNKLFLSWSTVGIMIGIGLFSISFFVLQGDFDRSIALICCAAGFGSALGGAANLKHTISNARQKDIKTMQYVYAKWSMLSLIIGIIISATVSSNLTKVGIILPLFIGAGAVTGTVSVFSNGKNPMVSVKEK